MKKDNYLFLKLRSIRLTPRLLVSLLLLILLGTALAQANGPNQVALVVVHGDGEMITECVEFSQSEITGLDVLQRADIDLNVQAASGLGATVCRIDNEGCTYPQDSCFCECEGGPTCIFWSYWHLKGDEWGFSNLGASNRKVSHGAVEGWVWGEGMVGSSGTEPPAVEFNEICMTPPTATPSPTATHTPLPTATPTATPTPQPTATPEPTDTPEPEPTPVIHSFSADRLSINAGESVTLRWDLSDAEAAYLRYDGNEVGVISPGSQSVAPTTTTVYQLIAENDGGEAIKEITITVNAAPPTATPMPTSTTAPAQAQPVAQTAPTHTPLPTATPSPTPATQAEPVAAAVTAPSPTATSTPLPPPPVSPETSPPPATPPATATTSEVIALVPTAAPVETLPPLERRFTTEVETEESFGSRLSALLLYGGVAGVILLFLVGPVLLLGAGGVAWWLRKER